jgi:hypothetical protein
MRTKAILTCILVSGLVALASLQRSLPQRSDVGAKGALSRPAAVGPLNFIKLERIPCGPTCPNYTVTITADGKVLLKNTPPFGDTVETVNMISGADLAFLDVELQRTRFDDLALRYRNRHCTAFDSAGVVILVGRGEVVKQMIYDFGCVNAVDHRRENADYARVISLANTIDKIAGVK